MKWIILAWWEGTRLYPITKYINKHLLPVYNKPMILYPLQTLLDLGVSDICIISSKESIGDLKDLLWNWEEYDCIITYVIQKKPDWIVNALTYAKGFVEKSSFYLILWDNIFVNRPDKVDLNISNAHLYIKKVDNPEFFWVVEINDWKITSIEEKPKSPKSNFIQTWLYKYDSDIFNFIDNIEISKRGEYEISDLNKIYMQKNELSFLILDWPWFDAWRFDSLLEASNAIKNNIN